MYKILLSVIGLMAFSAFSSTAQVTLARLTCEHQVDPQAVNDLHPRFGWELQSAKRNVSQKAYEVIVWEGKKPIWKTGRVESDQSQYIAYGGPALSSGKAYQWQVRVW
ncbi:MAG: hypothetical protein RL732_1378, partial [Bacteroidota bacterium]